MHAARSILAYNPLHLNEIVREGGTVSHPTEPGSGHAIDGALLVMSSPISDGGDNQPGLNVVSYVSDGLEASCVTENLSPNVVMMDSAKDDA